MQKRNRRLQILSVLLAGVLSLVLVVVILPLSISKAAVNGRNLPANGKILSIIGQDTSTLSEYRSAVMNGGFGAPEPGGVTLYTNLLLGGNPPPLAGMYGTVNYGSGDYNFDTTLSQYPQSSLAVGLYLSDTNSGCGNQPLRAIIGPPN